MLENAVGVNRWLADGRSASLGYPWQLGWSDNIQLLRWDANEDRLRRERDATYSANE